MDIFAFRDSLIEDFKSFSRSFTTIKAEDIRQSIAHEYDKESRYWPAPLLQINPNYEIVGTVQELAASKKLHPKCGEIFRFGDKPLDLYSHQRLAISFAQTNKSYVVTTGTGSGKSLSFFIPIVDNILKAKEKNPTPRTRAIIIYPMNALANSQLEEINKFLKNSPDCGITVGRYTGQENKSEREQLKRNPPDILLTNYMMLELLLMRHEDKAVISACQNLQFLVMDELHTYRGRQGADVAILVRRLKRQLHADNLICIGTSATMSSSGSSKDQQKTVSKVVSTLFGTEIPPGNVIGESLERVTNKELAIAAVKPNLASSVKKAAADQIDKSNIEAFENNPLAVWIELTLSVEKTLTENAKRAKPKSINEVIELLIKDSGCSETECRKALTNLLQIFGENSPFIESHPKSKFAFKLHQFISGPGLLSLTLEPPMNRTITLDGQTMIQGKDNKPHPLFHAYFCRECGQEYIPVWTNDAENVLKVSTRDIDDTSTEDDGNYGYICPMDSTQQFSGEEESLPDEWKELKKGKTELTIKAGRRKDIPKLVNLDADGNFNPSGVPFWFQRGKFKLCVNCLTTHSGQGRDKHRLLGLAGEGRSSATSMLTLGILNRLYDMPELANEKDDQRKLLGFSDNRQDAALQSGHFNSMMDNLVLRSGLITVLRQKKAPMKLNEVVEAIMDLFKFGEKKDPNATHYCLKHPDKVVDDVWQYIRTVIGFCLGYRLLCDLEQRHLYNNPSLEDLNLMSIGYVGLDDIIHDSSLMERNQILSQLSEAQRRELFHAFLALFRDSLSIQSTYFDSKSQKAIADINAGELADRWKYSFREFLRLEHGRLFILKSRKDFPKSQYSLISGSEKSGINKKIRRLSIWSDTSDAIRLQISKAVNAQDLIRAMVDILTERGLLLPIPVNGNKKQNADTGWQLNANHIRWSFNDDGNKPSNEYFRKLYLDLADALEKGASNIFEFESSEHTAQLQAEEREKLEMRFRFKPDDADKWEKLSEEPFKKIPVLYCSPTMELGIDISALNFVFMRNIPPTPANYVQRAGRAGRSGQQALSLSYCASRSPHDQWFFNHPLDMVQGVVKEPTLDLTNQSLTDNHLHSVWLACADNELPPSVAEILDLSIYDKSKKDNFPVRKELMDHLMSTEVTERAIDLGKKVLSLYADRLKDQHWYNGEYVEKVIKESAKHFDRAFDNWRHLYSATKDSMEDAFNALHVYKGKKKTEEIAAYNRQMLNASRQLAKLEGVSGKASNNDFYTYRYLASQGFLPGYNFPALPLMAWIPPIDDNNEDEGALLSRSRFIGLSEFGPRAMVYHRGRIFKINRVRIPASDLIIANGESPKLLTQSISVCPRCGYFHNQQGAIIYNQCVNCGTELTSESEIRNLYRIEMVETSQASRISIEDENRQRMGFDLRTYYDFNTNSSGTPINQKFIVKNDDDDIASLVYGPAATVYRVNLGWKYRKNKNSFGFLINPKSGLWEKSGPDDETDDNESPETDTTKTAPQAIVPFVTDRRNILLIEPVKQLSKESMATLQAALKRAIEQVYQLESSELTVEPLPDTETRNLILIYETGSGGAGVLSHLIGNPESLRQVAETALDLMHYKKPSDGKWIADAMEDKDGTTCIKGCYHCLLSYYNQPEHDFIDRADSAVKQFLVSLTRADSLQDVVSDNNNAGNNANQTKSKKDRWLDLLHQNGGNDPDSPPKFFNRLGIEDAFAYKNSLSLIMLEPLDADTKDEIDDMGWQIIDFTDESQWNANLAANSNILKGE